MMVNAPYEVWLERVKEILAEQGMSWDDVLQEDYDFYSCYYEFENTPEQAVEEYRRSKK